MPTFDDFQTGFFALFLQRQFRSVDFRTYLQRPAPRRSGDEASIVDNSLVSPLLGLLGFAPGEQVYNQNNKRGRPDLAPTTGEFGVCFVVEDKSTGLDLDLDLTATKSHLCQLCGYLRSLGLRSGWLTNGRRLMVWRLDNPEQPACILDLDIPAAVQEWEAGGAQGLSPAVKQALLLLWEQFRKETFADLERLEREIATDLEEWQHQALPVGANQANQDLLVGAVKTLLQAAYGVFIRLMLIRVCEDKGILPNRLLSDDGLKHWQEDIERYFLFATGNPYEPLLDMAYNNAQNIYAHFFTGRELFNWYTLSRLRFVRVLYQLSRFNFADVDSDLIGTIYNTYVERPEKKQKGQRPRHRRRRTGRASPPSLFYRKTNRANLLSANLYL